MLAFTPRRLGSVCLVVVAVAVVYGAPMAFAQAPGPRANFWVLVLTAGAAVWYAWLTYRLLRGQQTPALVVAFENGCTIVRNFGQGAALNVSLTDGSGQTIGRTTDLGSGGCGSIPTSAEWTINEARFIFCQDVGGRWHMTKCLGQALAPAQNIPIANEVIGRVFNPPPAVRRAVAVRSAIEHWVQLNRTWDPRNWFRRATYLLRKRRAENRILRLIREARAAGRLGTTFTAADVSTATDLERIVADRFLPNHLVGNRDGEREIFFQEADGRYRLR